MRCYFFLTKQLYRALVYIYYMKVGLVVVGPSVIAPLRAWAAGIRNLGPSVGNCQCDPVVSHPLHIASCVSSGRLMSVRRELHFHEGLGNGK